MVADATLHTAKTVIRASPHDICKAVPSETQEHVETSDSSKSVQLINRCPHLRASISPPIVRSGPQHHATALLVQASRVPLSVALLRGDGFWHHCCDHMRPNASGCRCCSNAFRGERRWTRPLGGARDTPHAAPCISIRRVIHQNVMISRVCLSVQARGITHDPCSSLSNDKHLPLCRKLPVDRCEI